MGYGQHHGQHCPRYAERKTRFRGRRTKPPNLTCVIYSYAQSNDRQRARSFRKGANALRVPTEKTERRLAYDMFDTAALAVALPGDRASMHLPGLPKPRIDS